MFPETAGLIDKYRKEKIYSGAVYEFISREKREKHALGLAQTYPFEIAVKEDMLFDVASLTKVVCTTTVILKLMEEGRIDIDRPLHDYLPPFRNTDITLRHLLTHTSDIQTYIPHRGQLDQTQLRQAYYGLVPGAQLGKAVAYTDAGTILLGFMLEVLYGKDVTEVFCKEVLEPLEMKSSTFMPGALDNVVPTENVAGFGLLKGVTHDPKARVLAEHAGNAGLFASLSDLEKFTEMYLNYGKVNGESFMKRSTIENLLADWTPEGNGGRSLGWKLMRDYKDQHPMLFHTGYTGTFLLIDVLDQSAFIFLSNRVHPEDHRKIYIEKRNEILEKYLKEKALQ